MPRTSISKTSAKRRGLVHFAALSVCLGILCLASHAHAYAWMMRHGYAQCSTCHTDPSGGEGLTQMGRVQSQETLSTTWSEAPGPTESALLAHSLDEPDWLRLGGSARYFAVVTLPKAGAPAALRHFPMQADVYSTWYSGSFRAGLSLGYARIPLGSPHLQAAQVFQKESGHNLLSRWHWIGLALSERSLLRLGRLNLPFGMRVSEHVLWAREATFTDRESDQQHGLALSGWGGRWRWEAMLVAGNYQVQPDRVRERGYSGYLEYLFDGDLALGASSQLLTSAQSVLTGRTEPTVRQAHGAMWRWVPFTELVVLGEFDVLSVTGRQLGYTGFSTFDVEPTQGLHLAATAELLDAGKRETSAAAPGAGKPTTGAWLTLLWFPLPHWDLRVDFVVRHPANKTLQGQLHFYL